MIWRKLLLADGSGAYNRYFGRLDTGKVKIRGVMARKRDTPEYVKIWAVKELRPEARQVEQGLRAAHKLAGEQALQKAMKRELLSRPESRSFLLLLHGRGS